MLNFQYRYQKGWDWQCAGYTVDEQCKLPIAPFEQVIQRSDGMYIVHVTPDCDCVAPQ